MLSVEILVVLALTLVNGFFAMSEMAIVSARRARLEVMAEAGDRGARRAVELSAEPSRFLSAVQIGITLVGIVSGAFGTATLGQKLAETLSEFPTTATYAEPIAFGVVVIAITFLSIVLGELVPKRIALAHPELIAARVARPISAIAAGARPVVHLLSGTTATILRLMRIRSHRDQAITEEEVETIIEEGTQSGLIDPAEQAMVHEVIGLGERSVTQIMTRRSAVYWIDVADDPKVVRAELRQCPYSRVVVAKGGSIDEPLGFVHKKDLLDLLLEGKPLDIEKNVRDPIFVPEVSSVLDVLELFREKRNHFAFVLDEFGTFEGVVTLTDVLEAITGDIPEEHDEQVTSSVTERADGSYLIDGRAEFDDLEKLLGVAAPADARFHTVAGLALELFGRIPREGDTTEFGSWKVEVMDMDGRRIDKLLFSRRDEVEG
jgi:putative hemolysin